VTITTLRPPGVVTELLADDTSMELAAHPGRAPSRLTGDGDWPRTTRILPWLIAAFIAMLWLVPFDTITLTVSLPFQLKLDRILLPVLVVIWSVALATQKRTRPRLQLTPIHVAVGSYVVVAFLSVILNINWLNRQLLLQASIKQLVLLASYAMFFVIVASAVRPREVAAFVKYSLILAVVCAIGSLWELHFHRNLFYQWTHSLLPPSLFVVPQPTAGGVDELGRQLTLGPTEAPLELATIVAIALPIALVGLMRSVRRGHRTLYLLACALLVAAGFATYRKSALVIPAVLIVVLAMFRPRQSLRLLPLGLVLFVLVHFLARGAIGSLTSELSPGKVTAVGSTVHRTSGYEAIRPILWSRPALGEGYGSYDANAKRILDSQVLMSAIETGVVGVVCYLAMMLTTLSTAARIFRRSHSERAWLALGLGLGAVAYLVASFLYDALSFPHGPYIFLTFGAFVAIMFGDRGAGDGARRRHRFDTGRITSVTVDPR
jgi:hypothetical protein